jgi:EF hand
MKTMMIHLTLALMMGVAASAQPPGGPGGTGRPDSPQGPGGPGGPGGFRPPPFWVLFDTDHDGVISEQEINNASTVLKGLDKNGDGELTPEELRPPRPEGPGPEGADQGERRKPVPPTRENRRGPRPPAPDQ